VLATALCGGGGGVERVVVVVVGVVGGAAGGPLRWGVGVLATILARSTLIHSRLLAWCAAVLLLCRYMPPLLLRSIINFVQDRTDHDEDYKGYLLGLGIFGCLLAMSLCENQCVTAVLERPSSLRFVAVRCWHKPFPD